MANLIDDVTSTRFKLTKLVAFFPAFAGAQLHNFICLTVCLGVAHFHLLNLHGFLFVTSKLVAMEMIAALGMERARQQQQEQSIS